MAGAICAQLRSSRHGPARRGSFALPSRGGHRRCAYRRCQGSVRRGGNAFAPGSGSLDRLRCAGPPAAPCAAAALQRRSGAAAPAQDGAPREPRGGTRGPRAGRRRSLARPSPFRRGCTGQARGRLALRACRQRRRAGDRWFGAGLFHLCYILLLPPNFLQSLYERSGFVSAGRLPGYYAHEPGGPVDALEMVAMLPV